MSDHVRRRHATRAAKDYSTRQLELLAIRSCQLADRVAAGLLPFIEAVDMAYSAAEWVGLIEAVGDDAVQAVLAASFANASGKVAT
jgi:hypothetical protein